MRIPHYSTFQEATTQRQRPPGGQSKDNYTLQMFCLLNSQTNACKPNLKTTSSDFNRLESVTKIFCFHAIPKDICLFFLGVLFITFHNFVK